MFSLLSSPALIIACPCVQLRSAPSGYHLSFLLPHLSELSLVGCRWQKDVILSMSTFSSVHGYRNIHTQNCWNLISEMTMILATWIRWCYYFKGKGRLKPVLVLQILFVAYLGFPCSIAHLYQCLWKPFCLAMSSYWFVCLSFSFTPSILLWFSTSLAVSQSDTLGSYVTSCLFWGKTQNRELAGVLDDVFFPPFAERGKCFLLWTQSARTNKYNNH